MHLSSVVIYTARMMIAMTVTGEFATAELVSYLVYLLELLLLVIVVILILSNMISDD